MTSLRANPPFRAEQIGSFKRPQELMSARADLVAGKTTQLEVEAVTATALADIVEMQKRVGIKSISDGEFYRNAFFEGFHENLDGYEYVKNFPLSNFKTYVPDIDAFKAFHGGENGINTYVATGKIKWARPCYGHTFEKLKALVEPDEVKNLKVTLAAPEWQYVRQMEHSYAPGVYENDDAYLADLAQAYRDELKDLYKRGCRNVQFDDPCLTFFCHKQLVNGYAADGIDPEKVLDSYIKLYNDITHDMPADMCIGLHLCRGNGPGGIHMVEGGYDRIAAKLFNDLKHIDAYYLEYDTERAGTFDPLMHLPAHKKVVLGLISSKLAELESIDTLKSRVLAAAEVIATKGSSGVTTEQALDQLAISPQCGFASATIGNKVAWEDVEKKLALTVEAAKAIWGES